MVGAVRCDMNEFNSFMWQMAITQAQRPSDNWKNRNIRLALSAMRLYERALWRGRIARLVAWLRRRPYHLLDLADVSQHCQIINQHHVGLQTVPMTQIRGSDGRSHDFDAAFHPRQSHNREPWLRVATARLAGESMPPIKLVRVGDIYFVRDGHHRISVARSMGQRMIEAEVTVWQAADALPWKRRGMPLASQATAA